MSSLFPDEPAPAGPRDAPLAERMRPRTFEEFVGQDDLLAPGRPLRDAIDRDLLQSIILWGPPGTGKTQVISRALRDLMAREKSVLWSRALTSPSTTR